MKLTDLTSGLTSVSSALVASLCCAVPLAVVLLGLGSIAADTVLLSDDHALHKYVIPSAAKPDLLEGLLALGVSHVRLFPELDGLSMYLKQEFFRPAQGPQPGGMALAD